MGARVEGNTMLKTLFRIEQVYPTYQANRADYYQDDCN